jgi:hypothetical protein
VKLAKPGGLRCPLPSPVRIGLSVRHYEESRHPAHLVLQTPGRRVHRARWCRLCRGTIRDVAPRCSLTLPLGTAARSAYRRLAPVRDPVNQLRQRNAQLATNSDTITMVVGCTDQDFRRPIMLLWSDPKPHMLVQ